MVYDGRFSSSQMYTYGQTQNSQQDFSREPDAAKFCTLFKQNAL